MSNNRTDLELITSLVDEGTRILDVGCGSQRYRSYCNHK